MEATATLAGKALTATQARSTPAKPVNTETWAKWADFELRGNSREKSQLEFMVDAVARFCRDLKEGKPPRWLSLLGSSGAGKTHLAKRVWHWAKGRQEFQPKMVKGHGGLDEVQYPGQWCWWPEMAELLHGNQGYDRMHELGREGFVVFDEIGMDRDVRGHVRDCLTRTLCARVGKWTVITGNMSLEQVGEMIDARLASRMVRDGSTVVQVDVTDYAMKDK